MNNAQMNGDVAGDMYMQNAGYFPNPIPTGANQ